MICPQFFLVSNFSGQSLEIARRYGYAAAEGDALFYMSKAQHQLGDTEQALSTIRMAYRLLEDIGDPAAKDILTQLHIWEQSTEA